MKCIKDKNNPYDSEAIKVVMKEIGTVGYIANSPYTTATGTMSAGRIYEKGLLVAFPEFSVGKAFLKEGVYRNTRPI